MTKQDKKVNINKEELQQLISNEIDMMLNRFISFDENVDMFDTNEYNDKIIIKPVLLTKKVTSEHIKMMKDMTRSYERIYQTIERTCK